jgi:hypothetical protein
MAEIMSTGKMLQLPGAHDLGPLRGGRSYVLPPK